MPAVKTALAILLGATLCGAAPFASADEHEGLAAKFKAADKDNDGTLDKTEAAAMPMVLKRFDALDTDKDGTVSMDEIKGGMRNAHRGKHGKGRAAFAAADKDKDGTLDKEEAKSMKHVAEHFDEIDGDKDGTVSLEEVHAFMKSHKHAK